MKDTLKEAKEALKTTMIEESGEEAYQKEIQDRVRYLCGIKQSGDILFGRDTEQFKEDVLSAVMEKYKDDEESQLYELCLTSLALDTFN